MNIYICYDQSNQWQVEQLIVESLRHSGYDPWTLRKLVPGKSSRAQMDAAIKGSDAFIFAATPDSIQSADCTIDIQLARERDINIIPVRLHSAMQLPEWLNDLQTVDLSSGPTPFAVAQLLYSIRVIGEAKLDSIGMDVPFESESQLEQAPNGGATQSSPNILVPLDQFVREIVSRMSFEFVEETAIQFLDNLSEWIVMAKNANVTIVASPEADMTNRTLVASILALSDVAKVSIVILSNRKPTSRHSIEYDKFFYSHVYSARLNRKNVSVDVVYVE